MQLPGLLGRPGIESTKDRLFLVMLLAVAGAAVVAGLYLQISPAREAAFSRTQELEALFTSFRQTSARCTSEPKE